MIALPLSAGLLPVGHWWKRKDPNTLQWGLVEIPCCAYGQSSISASISMNTLILNLWTLPKYF